MSENKMMPIIKRNSLVDRKKTAETLNAIAELITDEIKNNYREHYKMPEGTEKINEIKHNMITGQALHLAQYVMEKGGRKSEVFNALMYLSICIDTRKYILDYSKAYRDFGISELLEKYGAKRPKKTE